MAKSGYFPGYLALPIGAQYIVKDGNAISLCDLLAAEMGDLEFGGRRFCFRSDPDTSYMVRVRERTGKDVYEEVKGPKIPDFPEADPTDDARERGRTAAASAEERASRVLMRYTFEQVSANGPVHVFDCIALESGDAKHTLTAIQTATGLTPVSCSCPAFTFYDQFCGHCEGFRTWQESLQ